MNCVLWDWCTLPPWKYPPGVWAAGWWQPETLGQLLECRSWAPRWRHRTPSGQEPFPCKQPTAQIECISMNDCMMNLPIFFVFWISDILSMILHFYLSKYFGEKCSRPIAVDYLATLKQSDTSCWWWASWWSPTLSWSVQPALTTWEDL